MSRAARASCGNGPRRSPGGYLGAAAEAELAQDVVDVGFGGALGDDQSGGDVLVAQPLGDKVRDLLFAAGQGRRGVPVRCRAGLSRLVEGVGEDVLVGEALA